MTTLSKDEIIAWAQEAGFKVYSVTDTTELERFSTLCRADLVAENERLKEETLSLTNDALKFVNERDALRAENERLASLAKEYRDNGDRLLDVADSLRAELSALRAGSGEAVGELLLKHLPEGTTYISIGGCYNKSGASHELRVYAYKYLDNELLCYGTDNEGEYGAWRLAKLVFKKVPAITSLYTHPHPSAGSGEVVAWMHPDSYSLVTAHQKETNEFQYGDEFLAGHTQPLYTTPQPSAVPVVRELVEALEAVDALIEHQYTGTRDGMNALQNAADDAHDALKTGQQWLKENT